MKYRVGDVVEGPNRFMFRIVNIHDDCYWWHQVGDEDNEPIPTLIVALDATPHYNLYEPAKFYPVPRVVRREIDL